MVNKGGATSKCTKATVAAATEYLDECAAQEKVPTTSGLAGACDCHRVTLHTWANIDRNGFRNILERCNRMQEEVLLQKGLTSEFNSAIVKLMLGKHGYHDTSKLGVTGADGGPIKTENKTWTVNVVKPDAKFTDS